MLTQWLHVLAPGRIRVLLFVCVTCSLFTADSILSYFFIFVLVRDLPSVLKLISPDLSNLVLLYPISLITQTLSFPLLLDANGLSLLW